MFHDPAAGGRRTIDVGGADASRLRRPPGAGTSPRCSGEALRLAYVALTRARHQAVLHWASTWDSRQSPLARLLFAADLDAGRRRARRRAERGRGRRAAAGDRRRGRRGHDRDRASDGRCAVPGGRRAGHRPATLAVRPFDRSFDARGGDVVQRADVGGQGARRWRASPRSPARSTRTSTVGVLGRRAPMRRATSGCAASTLPLAAMAGGARVGTLVHGVLEHTDFTAADLDAELRRALGRRAGLGPGPASVPTEASCAGSRLAIDTPLGPLAGDVRLRDVRTGRPSRRADVRAAPRRRRHAVGRVERRRARRPARAAPRARRRRSPATPRTCATRCSTSGCAATSPAASTPCCACRRPTAPPRFAVVDYKTNWLGVDGDGPHRRGTTARPRSPRR